MIDITIMRLMPGILDRAFCIPIITDLDGDIRIGMIVIEVSSFGGVEEGDGDLLIVPGRGGSVGEGLGAEHGLFVVGKEGFKDSLGMML